MSKAQEENNALMRRFVEAQAKGDLDAVKEMIAGGITTRLPASFLQLHRHVTIMLDDDAATGLDAGARARRDG